MDEHLISTLVEAVSRRHSVRTFEAAALPKETVDSILLFISKLDAPFAHNVRFEKFTAQPGKALYNNGVNPPDNLAMLAQTDLISISKAGFMGELVMLYAVSEGLSTCWFGHYNLGQLGRYIDGIAMPERIRQSTMGYGYGRHVDVGERAICCMPFGRRDESKKRFVDFVAGKNGTGRKPLAQLMEKPDMAPALPESIRAALELARFAPSAANSQFWRFGISDDFKRVTVAKPVGYKHFKWEHPDVDIGMCAAHIWIGLLYQGISPSVQVDMEQDRPVWTFTVN